MDSVVIWVTLLLGVVINFIIFSQLEIRSIASLLILMLMVSMLLSVSGFFTSGFMFELCRSYKVCEMQGDYFLLYSLGFFLCAYPLYIGAAIAGYYKSRV